MRDDGRDGSHDGVGDGLSVRSVDVVEVTVFEQCGHFAVARRSAWAPECGAGPGAACRSAWAETVVAVVTFGVVTAIDAAYGDALVRDSLDGGA